MPERGLLLRLNRLPYLKPRERILLAHRLESADALEELSPVDFARELGHPVPLTRDYLMEGTFDLERDRELLERGEVSLLSFFDDEYPPRLRTIYDPPLLLFFRGNRDRLTGTNTIALVGTRTPEAEALAAARSIAAGAAGAGCTVISGLARGIDGAAHRGALEITGGRTVAVLGSGIDVLYPPQHRPLAREILGAGGALVSEYSPGTPVRKQQFPQRNRIIAGMSGAVMVVQAPRDSGALITSNFALSEDRPVLLHPVGVGSAPSREGTQRLAEEGAPVYESWSALERGENWPPPAPELESVDETLAEWGAPGSSGRRRRSPLRRRGRERRSGQALLSLFLGDDEELET
ncbi:MAG: DNA-processing protein DprA [Alkalispirochaetaceae bacterium]